jgi:hypothetical protein
MKRCTLAREAGRHRRFEAQRKLKPACARRVYGTVC